MYHLEFNIDPVAKGRPRFSRLSGVAYTPAKTRQAEAELRFWMHKKWCADLGLKPLAGPLHVIVRFIFKRPKSVSVKSRPFHTVKPDLSNTFKLVEDSGNGILWDDDSQIVGASIFKLYGDESKIVLSIKEVCIEQIRAHGDAS